MKKSEFIWLFIEKKMAKNKLPYGMQYLNKLADIEKEAEREWLKQKKQIIIDLTNEV